ncbi:hypothetical protein D9M72_239900 [compost metagenome]
MKDSTGLGQASASIVWKASSASRCVRSSSSFVGSTVHRRTLSSSRANCSGVSRPTTLTASSGSSALRSW